MCQSDSRSVQYDLSIIHTLIKIIYITSKWNFSNFYFQLLAYDGGSPAKTGSVSITVVVEDANDNPPQFSIPLYQTSVREDTPAGSTFLQVHTQIIFLAGRARIIYHAKLGTAFTPHLSYVNRPRLDSILKEHEQSLHSVGNSSSAYKRT